ncbi:MAG: hypothetical protein AAFO81_09045 [Pseudomonadota bacterium]
MKAFLLSFVVLLAACAGNTDRAQNEAVDLDTLAERYVVLELAMGEIDTAHVDAYSGPQALRDRAQAAGWTLDEISERATQLERDLSGMIDKDTAERINALILRIRALQTRIVINQGNPPDFDTESQLLFAARAPDIAVETFQQTIAQIDALLPGAAPLAERISAFRERFAIPADKLDVVFVAALEECRRRTLEHIALPEGESFKIEYVTDKSWSGYNWYQGDAHSLIQVNTDFPVQIERAVDLGCHEGYPGHHTYNVLVEQELLNKRGWIEYSLYPLFSPQSLIAEGSANYGIELAFPGEERLRFERDVLFPMAGLDANDAAQYYEFLALTKQLSYAGNEVAREYLNGNIDADTAALWLQQTALSPEDRAKQRVRFMDDYRSYVINYNLGQDIVRNFVERYNADQAARWKRFEDILSRPVAASDLR